MASNTTSAGEHTKDKTYVRHTKDKTYPILDPQLLGDDVQHLPGKNKRLLQNSNFKFKFKILQASAARNVP